MPGKFTEDDELLVTMADTINVDAEVTGIGAENETAPANDTASSGLNGRLQRVAQNITTLTGKLPASLGIKTAAGSLSIAPASDATFVTSNTTQLPSSLGIKTAANSFSIAPASDSSFVVIGNVAHDSPASGPPVPIGGYATDTPSGLTQVTNADRAQALTDRYGILYVAAANYDGGAGADGRGSLYGFSGRVGPNNTSTFPVAVGGFVFNGTNWDRARGDTTGTYVVGKAGTAGGVTQTRVVTGTTGVIKGSAGQLFNISLENLNATKRYFHLYNKATAPTLSTDTPVRTIVLAGSSSKDLVFNDVGLEFTTGISWSYTTDDASAPASAATSTELHFSSGHK